MHADLGEHHRLHTDDAADDTENSSSTLIEAAGVCIALQTFAHRCHGQTVVVVCDNKGAVACINKMYSPVRHISLILSTIGCICLKHDIHVRAVHRTRDFLAAADALSRHDVAKFVLALAGRPTAELPVDPEFVETLMSAASEVTDIARLSLQ
jgi:hypothetical protein